MEVRTQCWSLADLEGVAPMEDCVIPEDSGARLGPEKQRVQSRTQPSSWPVNLGNGGIEGSRDLKFFQN